MPPRMFRKKPIVVQAIQWTGDIDEVTEFMGFTPPYQIRFSLPHGAEIAVERSWVDIPTREGVMRAEFEDWIIREPFPTDDRHFYPCKPDIFAATYYPLSEPHE